jgi:hypothetical protein
VEEIVFRNFRGVVVRIEKPENCRFGLAIKANKVDASIRVNSDVSNAIVTPNIQVLSVPDNGVTTDIQAMGIQ